MMNKGDLDFIRESRKQIRTLRENDITLKSRKKIGSHPVTGEAQYEYSEDIAPAVVTKVTSGEDSFMDNDVIDSIKTVTGDIVVDINLEDFPKGVDISEVNSMLYEDISYRVMSFGKLGLGENNRVELLGRRTY